MMSNDLVLPKPRSKVSKIIWAALGFAFIIPLFFFYTQFFERNTHLRRKALLKWLKNNNLPKPEISGRWCTWYIGEYSLTLNIDDDAYVSKGTDLQLSSWHNGYIDTYRYNKILKILKEEKASYE